MARQGYTGTVSALYVETGGCYYGLDDVDPWDIQRDARQYKGPNPVVAHPPCTRWCQMASVVEARYGHQIGDDAGVFFHALWAVRRFGGVLEHPAETLAWKFFGLMPPNRSGGWTRCDAHGWCCHVEQGHYGHRARKATWLYAVGSELPSMRWGRAKASAWVGFGDSEKYPDVPRLGKKEAKRTPLEFRDLLLRMARTVKP